MDKNFVIAMILMLAVFFGWQAVFAPKPPVPGVEGDTAALEGSPAQASPTPDSPKDTPDLIAATPPGLTDPDQAPAAALATSKVKIEKAVIETDLYTATVSNDGGQVTSWQLKEYMDKAGKDGMPYEMIWSAPAGRFALAAEFGDATPSFTVYDDYEFVEKSDDTIVMRRMCEDGLEVTKTLTFAKDKYLVTLTLALHNTGSAPIQGQVKVSTYAVAEQVKRSFFSPPKDFINLVSYIDDKFDQEDVFKVEPEEVPGSELVWAGFSSNYFLFGMAPENTKETKLITKRPSQNLVESQLTAFNKQILPGENQQYQYTCFIGPKTEKDLLAVEHHFEMSRDFGWFSAIARVLVRVLNFFYKYVHNYGLAIIILTVIIKIILLPLTHKSYSSMKAMQKLQPEMKAMRELYGDDKTMLNQKMMELYKKHKVNPASGCLPILLQLPIFIAFYRALYVSIELRHTPFVWWIQDLSAPDPFYVTPILMGASMLISQKMTPTSIDPMQAKMMMAMPIVFTFLFLSFPTGLVIYWLVNNVLTIFQQMYINRPDPEQPAPEPEKPVAKGKKRK